MPPIFQNNEKKNNTNKDEKKEEKPPLNGPIIPIDPGPGFHKEGIPPPKNPPSSPEYVYDSATATLYDVYTNARCQLAQKGYKIDCTPNRMINENRGDPRYHGEDEKNDGERFGNKENNANQFMKIEVYDHYNCEAGNDRCTSKVVVLGIKYIYADKDCKKLVNVMKITGWSCQ